MWLDSKIDSIWRMNKWNNLIFCMLVQMQEGLKLIQSFLSVPCQDGSGFLVYETLKPVPEKWIYE